MSSAKQSWVQHSTALWMVNRRRQSSRPPSPPLNFFAGPGMLLIIKDLK